jgi:uncharacterized Ntn-hydrolase superfamily protein
MRDSWPQRRLVSLITALGACAVTAPQPASATWSIVAVDSRTGEVGSAGASCTPFVAGIVAVAPGRGVIVAQARSNMRARRKGIELLRAGASPQTVIDAITKRTFDWNAQYQQYGVAALGFEGNPRAFTGANTHPWHGHATTSGVAVQGNILTGPEVVQRTLAAFEENRSKPLAERLLTALEAGSAAGGDQRCGKQRALSAYIVVARRGDTARAPYLNLIVPGQRRGGANPVRLLRDQFVQLRRAALAAEVSQVCGVHPGA